jgi:hypothetical protein
VEGNFVEYDSVDSEENSEEAESKPPAREQSFVGDRLPISVFSEYRTSCERVIQVCRGDLTLATTDVVVNAANGHLRV